MLPDVPWLRPAAFIHRALATIFARNALSSLVIDPPSYSAPDPTEMAGRIDWRLVIKAWLSRLAPLCVLTCGLHHEKNVMPRKKYQGTKCETSDRQRSTNGTRSSVLGRRGCTTAAALLRAKWQDASECRASKRIA